MPKVSKPVKTVKTDKESNSKQKSPKQDYLLRLHAVFVVPFPLSDGREFIYVCEPGSRHFRLPYSVIPTAEALPRIGSEITLLGLETRVRVSHLIGIYTSMPSNDENVVAFAYAAKYIGGGAKVSPDTLLQHCRCFNDTNLEDDYNFHGSNYSIDPVKDFLAKQSIPSDRIVRFC